MIQCHCSLNDSRRRTITAILPLKLIDRITADKSESTFNDTTELLGIRFDWIEKEVILRRKCGRNSEAACFSSNQDRHNITLMTCIVEVFQVKGIVPNLVSSISGEILLTYLEFKNKNCWTEQKDNVNPPPHARDIKLEINCSVIGFKYRFQKIDLIKQVNSGIKGLAQVVICHKPIDIEGVKFDLDICFGTKDACFWDCKSEN